MVSPYRDFCGVGHFSWAISRKTRTELGFELHDTRRSYPRRVGRSDGMRHLLGNCVRLVAAPARTSCSRKELSLSRSMSCLRRPQSEKNTYDCFDRLLRHSFRPCSAATCRRGATTHAMAAKVILSLMLSLSVRASRCTGAVSQLCINSAVISRSPVYNPYRVVECLRGLAQKRFQSLYQPVENVCQKKTFGQSLSSLESRRHISPTKQAPQDAILIESEKIWDQIPRSLRKD